MPLPRPSPVCHSVAVCHSAAKRRNLLFLGVAIFVAGAMNAGAQTSNCGGLTSTKATTQLVYPPIARAAHIEGTVILLATFNPDGTVARTRQVAGAPMLQKASSLYIQALQANTYSGPRECAFVINFRLVGPSEECGGPNDDLQVDLPSMQHPDAQHFVLTLKNSCVTVMRDPASKIIHRFHL